MTASARRFVIDVRCDEAYARGHLAGSFSFPWSRIALESSGLPARHCPLDVLCTDAHEAAAVDAYMTRSGYSDVHVRVIDDDVARHFVTQSDEAGRTSCTTAPVSMHVPCALPNPCLQAIIDAIEFLLQDGGAQLGGRGTGLALDIGSGSGRDAIFLAMRGWSVTCVEVRRKLMQQAHHMAHKYALQHRIAHSIADVRHGLPFRAGTFDLVHLCRFIHRPTIARAVTALRSGGLLLCTHFLEGCERSAVGRPKNAAGFFLRGELAALLAAAGARVLRCDGAGLLPDGRPVVCALARRP